MKNGDKEKDQLLDELRKMRQRVAQLETAESGRKQLEERLRKSEGRLRTLYESCRHGIAAASLDGRITECNQAYAEMLGHTREELRGIRYQDITPPKWHALNQGAFRQVMERGYSDEFEKEYIRKDGTVFPVSLRTWRIDDEDGKPIGLWSIVRDITEQRRAEEDRERLFKAIEIAKEAINITASDGKIIYTNAAMDELFGYGREELIGKYPPVLNAGPNPEAVTKQIMDTIRSKDLWEGEIHNKRRDGTEFMSYARITALRDEEGSILNFISTQHDITERKRAEEALRHSKQLLERTLHSLRDAVFIISTSAETVEILDCNPAASQIFGYSRDEMVGRTTTFLHLDEAALEEFRRHLYPAIEQRGFLDNFEFRMKRKDGTIFPTDHTVMPLKDEQGNPIGWVSVVRDITERRRAEEEKRGLLEQLAQAQKMEALVALAGGIAHEYNNIIAVILGYADLALQAEELSDSVRRNLEVVRTYGVRGANLTRGLLAFSRKEVGEKKPVILRDVVDEVLSVTSKEFTSEGIELTVRHAMRVPPVMANPGLLAQVVMNLVINARHAMLELPVKKLTVQTGLEKGRPFIRVRDTGCGIAKEDIPRVFDPFFTTRGALVAGGVYDGKARGTGLGLSVCHSIVQGHGGEITVRSRIGKGTTFTVYLPAASKRKATQLGVEETRNEGVSRIMVVDDEEPIAELLVHILVRAGYPADAFTSPKDALKALRHEQYSLAFIDLQMPEMSGQDLIISINHLPPEKRPVKVILTGRLDATEETYAWLEVLATLPKPFTAEQVLQIVEKGLRAAPGRRAEKEDGTTGE